MPVPSWKRWLTPQFAVAAFLIAYVSLSLALNGGDVTEVQRLGQRRRAGDATGSLPYDGQFSYYIAVDPTPAQAGPHLDVPAYRYQRILYPLLARVAALGQAPLVPWSLLAINVLAQVAGTWAFAELLASYNVSRWHALAYGLWVGLVYSARLALSEPVAYGLVAGALLAARRERQGWATVLYGLAVFSKETALLFVVAHLAWLAARHDWRGAARLIAVAVLPFALFQLLILGWFGRLGVGSGGDLSTPFEIIPYLGLLRVGAVNPRALALLGVIFGPMIVLPSLWGIIASLRRMWRRDYALAVFALAANAGIIAFTPFSTFREPLGITRLATGLVMAVVLFGAHVRSRRALNYSLFWLAALVLLLNDR